MRLSVLLGLFASLTACAPASVPSAPTQLAIRAALSPAAEARGRTLAFTIRWTSIAHEPLVDRVRAILRAAGEAEIACRPRLSGSWSAACEASGPAAVLSAVEIALPPELAGPLVVPLDGRETRVAVDAWLAMTDARRRRSPSRPHRRAPQEPTTGWEPWRPSST
ncbi:hypothetical protein WMF30_08050 [Sorangium sp. So ce134]